MLTVRNNIPMAGLVLTLLLAPIISYFDGTSTLPVFGYLMSYVAIWFACFAATAIAMGLSERCDKLANCFFFLFVTLLLISPGALVVWFFCGISLGTASWPSEGNEQ